MASNNFVAAQFHPERSAESRLETATEFLRLVTMRIIPAIDLKDGKCVRLWQGDFDKTTEYSSDPTEVANQFADLAATDLHLVDLDGARIGQQLNKDIVLAIAKESRVEIQLGGGIRDAETVAGWLGAGVRRCVIGSLAITEPDTVKAWLTRFGGDQIVLALDVKLDEQQEPISDDPRLDPQQQ